MSPPRDAQSLQVAIEGQNPWWRDGSVPEARPYRRALVGATLTALLRDHPRRFQVILGPRRVGKTVSIYQMVADLLKRGAPPRSVVYLRLDHPDLIGLRMQPPERKGGFTFLFLDEVLYADRWDLWLKTMYDERWPVRVVATGSATAALRQARRESGVGRWEERVLSPLLFHDFLGIQGRTVVAPAGAIALDVLEDPFRSERPLAFDDVEPALRAYLLMGGYPELATVLTPQPAQVLAAQRIIKDDAVDRAIYKDLQQAYAVEQPLALEKLLYVLAGQVGGLLSTRSVAPAAGISLPTAERYVKYLEEASLVFLVPNYARTEEAIQRRGRKVYLGHPAVRPAMLLRGLLPLDDPAEMGVLFENAVATHLHALAQAHQVRLYHWRRERDEVDFVLDHPARPLAVEATWGERHDRRSLHRLAEAEPRLRGRMWLVGPGQPEVRPDQDPDGIGRAPADRWLLACGLAADLAVAGRTAPVA